MYHFFNIPTNVFTFSGLNLDEFNSIILSFFYINPFFSFLQVRQVLLQHWHWYFLKLGCRISGDTYFFYTKTVWKKNLKKSMEQYFWTIKIPHQLQVKPQDDVCVFFNKWKCTLLNTYSREVLRFHTITFDLVHWMMHFGHTYLLFEVKFWHFLNHY